MRILEQEASMRARLGAARGPDIQAVDTRWDGGLFFIVLLVLISLFRIQQLTASLMSKQNILERVTSERTSLAYRLERLEVRTGGLITDNISSSSEAGVRGAECGEAQQEGRGGPGPGHCLHGGQLRSCMLAPWRICAYMHTICKYSLHISVEKDVPH